MHFLGSGLNKNNTDVAGVTWWERVAMQAGKAYLAIP